jgi:flagellar biosynthesis chaperone FliJ
MERDERRRAQDAVERELDRQKRIWAEDNRRAEAEQIMRTRELEERKQRLAELERKEYEKGIEAKVIGMVEDRYSQLTTDILAFPYIHIDDFGVINSVRASMADHLNVLTEKIDLLSKELDVRTNEVENGRREIDRFRNERERDLQMQDKLQHEKTRLLQRLEIGQRASFCLIRYKKLLRYCVCAKFVRDHQVPTILPFP